MEKERFLMNNGGKLITSVHVTMSKDGATSIKFEYLHHKTHLFQYANIELGYQWASSALYNLNEDTVLNLFMHATEHGDASLMKCDSCSVI